MALLFFVNLDTLDGGGGSALRLGRLYPGKVPVPTAQEAGWASQPVWIGTENIAPTGTRSPDLPARSESLYRLSHPGSPVCDLVLFNSESRYADTVFGLTTICM